MQVDARIRDMWLRLLGQASRTSGVSLEKVEDGYHAVVLATDGNVSACSNPSATHHGPDDRELLERASWEAPHAQADYDALKSLIPHLDRTRAVYLNSGSAYQLSEIESLHEWAGELAQNVEAGAFQAFAVVDLEIFTLRIREEFRAVARSNPSATPHGPDDWEMLERAGGWKVERTGQDLRVADGRFTQQVNPLRAVVRMVLSRSNMRKAARAVRDETGEQFALHAELFRRFELRFRKFQPAVLDHYFVAYPQASCLAAGWDYWQVSGCAPAEAERTFEQAMEDFGNFLAAPSDEWLPAFLGGACEQITSGN